MKHPKLNRNLIFQGQLHPPYATVKLTKRGYKITQKNNQPKIKTYTQFADEDKAKLEALVNGIKNYENNEQE